MSEKLLPETLVSVEHCEGGFTNITGHIKSVSVDKCIVWPVPAPAETKENQYLCEVHHYLMPDGHCTCPAPAERAIELLKAALECVNNDKGLRGLCIQCREAITEYLKTKEKPTEQSGDCSDACENLGKHCAECARMKIDFYLPSAALKQEVRK